MKSFQGLPALFGLGLFLAAQMPSWAKAPATAGSPTMAHAMAHAIPLKGAAPSPTFNPLHTNQIKIEERIQLVNGPMIREYAVSGNAQETLVVYTESLNDQDAAVRVELYDAAGNALSLGSTSLAGANATEWAGQHSTFLLPTSGPYRLVLSTVAADAVSAAPLDYRLRVRSPTADEQYLIQAEALSGENRFDEALAAYEQAIAANPNLMAAYLSRFYTLVEMAQVGSALAEGDVNSLETIRQLFQGLNSELRSLAIADLRQTSALLALAIKAGKELPKTIVMEPQGYSELAIFLERGAASATAPQKFLP
jgi:tetratricopeptide (TPR) repeat protein